MNTDYLKTVLSRSKKDPVYFAKTVLGIDLWSQQNKIICDVRDYDRTCVKSGHKVGKSKLAATLAFWFACTHENARVIMTSASARQVRFILWREITAGYRSSAFLQALDAVCHDDPNSGFKLHSFDSEILGFSTDEPEKMAGLSGANMLFIIDEASGVPEPIFEAIEGNRAGGAKILLLSNPTKTSGYFFSCFRDPIKRNLWQRHTVSSEHSPNITGEQSIPGLATESWVEEKKIEWGPDYENSRLYRVRVKGEFPDSGDKNVVSLSDVERSIERHLTRQPASVSTLNAGLDPSGEGYDDSCLAVVVGPSLEHLKTWQRLDGPELARASVNFLDSIRQGCAVTLNVDSIGLGASVFDTLKRLRLDWLTVRGVKGSYASDNPEEYTNLRDQLWFKMGQWVKQGGTIPNDPKLETELAAVEFDVDARGRVKIESKKDLKKRIGRSPDRADALALALYEKSSILEAWKKITPSIRQHLKRTQRQRGTV